MDRVCQIHTRQWIAGSNIDFLRPRASPQDDDVLGMSPNDWDDLLMVPLDGGPRDLQGLIVCLIENIGVAGISLGHLAEETLGLVSVLFRVVIMPINHNIDARSDGSINTCRYFVLLPGVLQIAALVCSHGKPHDAALPVLRQPPDDVSIPILAHPL